MYKYLTFKECRFPKPVQERVPGGLPGARSWMSSRNAFLGCFQEHNFWKIKNCLKPHERVRKKFWHHVFVEGGTVWNNRHSTPPPIKKKIWKVIVHQKIDDKFTFALIPMYKYLTFRESARVGSQSLPGSVFLEICQERIPGVHPGMHSWRSSRNAFLGYFQEHDFW